MVDEISTDIKGSKTSAAEEREHEIALFARRITEVPSNMQARWSYNASNQVEYAGFAAKGLAEGTDGWLLHKFTYSSNLPTKREIAYGNWTNKASESYS